MMNRQWPLLFGNIAYLMLCLFGAFCFYLFTNTTLLPCDPSPLQGRRGAIQ